MQKQFASGYGGKMRLKSAAFTLFILTLSACTQESGNTTSISVATSSETTGGAVDIRSSISDLEWPLHNFDLFGSRFAPTDQITKENVDTLTPRWLFQHGVIDGVSNQTTPVIVDEIMYITDSRGSVYAVNARDGHLIWTYDVTRLLGGGRREGYIFRHRGVVYDEGVVYTAAGSFMFALDAKTGEPIESFGDGGQASVILMFCTRKTLLSRPQFLLVTGSRLPPRYTTT